MECRGGPRVRKRGGGGGGRGGKKGPAVLPDNASVPLLGNNTLSKNMPTGRRGRNTRKGFTIQCTGLLYLTNNWPVHQGHHHPDPSRDQKHFERRSSSCETHCKQLVINVVTFSEKKIFFFLHTAAANPH